MKKKHPIYGLMAEFDSVETLLVAIHAARSRGYREMDAYTPFPVEEVAHELGHRTSTLPLLVLIGGIIGCVGGFLMQYYASAISYPINVGGRPLNSWPSFIPVTFETTILGAALTAVLGMLALNGLPMPYHPVFNVPRFAMASRNKFFLVLEAGDKHFDRQETKAFLKTLTDSEVHEVEH